MNKLNLTVLGGGSAGWLTALYLRSIFSNDNITLIQSKEVGIIGVGEATTPHIVQFLRQLNIDPLDVIKKTDGTIKNGISFENWNGDNQRYFHAFADDISNFYIPNLFDSHCSDFYIKKIIKENLSFEDYIYQAKLSYDNKIDLKTRWAIHFDATKFANYLEDVGKSRNINVSNDTFETVSYDDNGFIKKINLKNYQSIDCDFVFDCSGFSRLIIGKEYQTKWISYSNHLPMKKAIAFWLDVDDKVPSYTAAIAMKYGWMWKIPLQHRTGSGYIFDSDYIDESQALAEAEEYYGKKLEIRKIISFDAGRYENVWVKNCMAVGLSSGFIEPLEATSIWMTITQLTFFRQFLNEIKNPRKSSIQNYNKLIANINDETMSFVFLHYMTKRNDTEFWKKFKDNYTIPKTLKPKLNLIKENNLRQYDIFQDTFTLTSFLQVCYGLQLFEKDINMSMYDNVRPNPSEYKEIINQLATEAPKHKDFLTNLNR